VAGKKPDMSIKGNSTLQSQAIAAGIQQPLVREKNI